MLHSFSIKQLSPNERFNILLKSKVVLQFQPFVWLYNNVQYIPQVFLKAAPVEKREMEKQTSVEEELTKKEALEKYIKLKHMKLFSIRSN